MEENRVTKGFKFSNKQKAELKNNVSQEIFQCNFNQILPCFNLNRNISWIGNISLSFNTILCLLQVRFDGWLNDEVWDLFIDFINLDNGFTTNKFPQDFPFYAVNIFGIIQLFKYGYSNMVNVPHPINIASIYTTLNLKKLKNCIGKGLMVSSIANLMEIYILEPNHHLTKFFGTLCVNQMHYVSALIETESRRVYTCDS